MQPEFEEEFEYELGEFAARRESEWGRGRGIRGRQRDLSASNRPLTLWTIGGFSPNDTTLNQRQLAEIGMLAGALARNPRTRSGKPVLTITGGFAPGENSRVANRRAIAVKSALIDALKRIDLSLLGSVGFNLATEPRDSDVSISLRERYPAPPDLPKLPTDYQPRNPLAPSGTPLPASRPGLSPEPGVLDKFRNGVDSTLRRHGVKNEKVRKGITDSVIFQIEQFFRSGIGRPGVDFTPSSGTPEP